MQLMNICVRVRVLSLSLCTLPTDTQTHKEKNCPVQAIITSSGRKFIYLVNKFGRLHSFQCGNYAYPPNKQYIIRYPSYTCVIYRKPRTEQIQHTHTLNIYIDYPKMQCPFARIISRISIVLWILQQYIFDSFELVCVFFFVHPFRIFCSVLLQCIHCITYIYALYVTYAYEYGI